MAGTSFSGDGTSQAEMITRVGQRIAIAAERYLNANGYEGYLKDYEWEYNLVDDKTVNAWCMPGGKIVFYTGILPIAKSETGIATINPQIGPAAPISSNAFLLGIGSLVDIRAPNVPKINIGGGRGIK